MSPKKGTGAVREDPAYYRALGRAIQVARTEQGLSRKELARRAGISYAYLSDIETGRGRPSSSALIQVARSLGMTPSRLLVLAEGYRERLAVEAAEPDELATGRRRGTADRALAASMPPPAPWFHRGALSVEDALEADLLRPPPLAEPALPRDPAGFRAELLALLEELPERDLRLVLELVRRLAGASGPRPSTGPAPGTR